MANRPGSALRERNLSPGVYVEGDRYTVSVGGTVTSFWLDPRRSAQNKVEIINRHAKDHGLAIFHVK